MKKTPTAIRYKLGPLNSPSMAFVLKGVLACLLGYAALAPLQAQIGVLLPPDSAMVLWEKQTRSLVLVDTTTYRPDAEDFVSKNKIPRSTNAPTSIILYHATDSIVMQLPKQEVELFKNAQVKQRDMVLNAYQIDISWKSHELHAQGTLDTLGRIRESPVFKEAEDTYYAEEMRYHLITNAPSSNKA